MLLLALVSAQEGTLIWRDKNVTDYSLLFINLNSSKEYFTIVDNNGKFQLSLADITTNASQHEVIKVYVCSNLPSKSDKQANKFICKGVVGYFFTSDEVGDYLTISVNSRAPNWVQGLPVMTNMCSDKNLYFCSLLLGNGTDIFYKDYFQQGGAISSRNLKSYTFKELRLDTLPSSGIYSISFLGSDGPNDIMDIDQITITYTTIRNPYNETAKAILQSNQSSCTFENGKQKIEKFLEPNQYKQIPTFSVPETSCTQIEVNIVKIEATGVKTSRGGVEINVVNLSLSFLMISILVHSIYLGYKKFKRKNK